MLPDPPMRVLVTVTSQNPGLPDTLATANNPGMCLLALLAIVKYDYENTEINCPL